MARLAVSHATHAVFIVITRTLPLTERPTPSPAAATLLKLINYGHFGRTAAAAAAAGTAEAATNAA